MIDNKLIFGERLKDLRKEKNLTIKELAEIFSTSISTVSRYENNQMNPTRDFQLKCSEFFNCSIDYLNGLSNIKYLNHLSYYDVYEPQSVNKKDLRDIEKIFNNLIESIKIQGGFTLDGSIVNEEDLNFLASSLHTTFEYAKLQNKIKNTLKQCK